MSAFQKYWALRCLKQVLVRSVFKPGTTVRIVRGPLKGCRYVVNERTGWAPIYDGWEPAAQENYRQFVRPEKVVYDLGAHTGIHSLLFSRLVEDRGKVFAFGPRLGNIRELEVAKALEPRGHRSHRSDRHVESTGGGSVEAGRPRQDRKSLRDWRGSWRFHLRQRRLARSA